MSARKVVVLRLSPTQAKHLRTLLGNVQMEHEAADTEFGPLTVRLCKSLRRKLDVAFARYVAKDEP